MNFEEIADEANRIEKELGITFDDVLNKLTQELGEFNDAVQGYRGRYSRRKEHDTNHIKEELGDVLFNLISVSRQLDIDVTDLENYPEATLHKFKSRIGDYKQ